jgi:competence protein ComEA
LSISVRIFLISFVIAAVFMTVAFVLIDKYKSPQIDVSILQNLSVTVSVEGEVNSPGVYTLVANARLNDALIAAGGLTPSADVSGLNLAFRISDGETIHIPSMTIASPANTNANPDGLVNINTASAIELDQLPGIGEVLAARIVEFRERFGPFTSVDQLIDVEGISESTVEELRPLVTVGG